MRKQIIILVILCLIYEYLITLNNQKHSLKVYYNEIPVYSENNNASVLRRNLNTWFDSLVIDKGGIDGIEEGAYITSNGALIGIITEVSSSTSVVRLITDSENKLSVKILDKEIYGLIDDYENDYLIMTGVKNDKVSIGDKVVTTGIGYIYPDNIYIGEVAKVVKNDFDSTLEVLIKTPIDFNNIYYVLVVNR